MYEAIDDPYCYPGTSVLKNRLNLRVRNGAEIERRRRTKRNPSRFTGLLMRLHHDLHVTIKIDEEPHQALD
jgi:hypothetical protein